MPAIYLHIGVPKTGTTYLQDVLYRNRRRLAEQGVLYPATYPEAHFDAAVDLRQLSFAGHRDRAVAGRWAGVVRAATRWPGAGVVVSHELLAGADDAAVAQAMDSLAGHDVHLVVTARDLGRQVPAMWQEYVKNDTSVGFEAYAERIVDERRSTKAARLFWRQQHLPEVMERWADSLPAGRVHMVTVPAYDAEPAVLWQRFAAATALPVTGLDVVPEPRNTSLGFAETELLRRVNRRLGHTLDWPAYEATVKSWFTEQLLEVTDERTAPRVPSRLRGPLEAHATAAIADLSARGVDVEGSLDDLRPNWGAPDGSPEPTAEEVLDAAVAAVARLLVDRADRDQRRRDLVGRVRRNPLLRRLPEQLQRRLKDAATGPLR